MNHYCTGSHIAGRLLAWQDMHIFYCDLDCASFYAMNAGDFHSGLKIQAARNALYCGPGFGYDGSFAP